MAFALRPEDFYHTGIIVPDLEAAMARLSTLAGYQWITPLSYTLPFRTANGTRELTSTFVHSPPDLALFAYYVDASGTRIEIVDGAFFPDFPAFLQSAAATVQA